MPRGRGRAKSAKAKRGRGKGSVKSKVGLRILGNASHSYQGYMRPDVGGYNSRTGKYLRELKYPKLSKIKSRAVMPVQPRHTNNRAIFPITRAGTKFEHMAYQPKRNNLKPQQRGMPRQITRSRVTAPNNAEQESSYARNNKGSKSMRRGQVARNGMNLKKRMAMLAAAAGPNANSALTRSRVAGRKTRRRSKGKGRKGKGSKRRV